MSDTAKDHLGRDVTAEQIVRQLSVMLGWMNCPPWHVLERDLAAKLRRMKELSSVPTGKVWPEEGLCMPELARDMVDAHHRERTMRPIIAKCTARHTVDSINGPLTTVILSLTPDGSLTTPRGDFTFVLHDAADLEAYQVGKRFRLDPKLL